MDVQRAQKLDAMYTATMGQDDEGEELGEEDPHNEEEEMVDRMEVFLPVVQSLVNALGGYEVSSDWYIRSGTWPERFVPSRTLWTQRPSWCSRPISPVTRVWLFYATSKSSGERTTQMMNGLFFDASTGVILHENLWP
jgi:hypothetical protein